MEINIGIIFFYLKKLFMFLCLFNVYCVLGVFLGSERRIVNKIDKVMFL